jgi:hypothetical protein
MPSEFASAKGQRHATKRDVAHVTLRVCQSGVDLAIELLNNLRWRAFRRTQAEPPGRFISGYGLTDMGAFGSVIEGAAVVTASARSRPACFPRLRANPDAPTSAP